MKLSKFMKFILQKINVKEASHLITAFPLSMAFSLKTSLLAHHVFGEHRCSFLLQFCFVSISVNDFTTL